MVHQFNMEVHAVSNFTEQNNQIQLLIKIIVFWGVIDDLTSPSAKIQVSRKTVLLSLTNASLILRHHPFHLLGHFEIKWRATFSKYLLIWAPTTANWPPSGCQIAPRLPSTKWNPTTINQGPYLPARPLPINWFQQARSPSFQVLLEDVSCLLGIWRP